MTIEFIPLRSGFHRIAFIATSLLWIGLASRESSVAAAGDQPPNVLIILADDLGFSDLGCYGGEIETPNLDALADSGIRFSHFYNTARCWPTRGSLLTGHYAQSIRRDSLPGMPSGNRGKRPEWAKLLPARLRAANYRSYHVGKWHVDGMPLEGGFDASYYLKDQGRFFNPTVHHLDDVRLPPVAPGTDFYATTELANRAITQLQHHHQHHADQPFFHYLAFAAPHFPLHALPEDIAHYRSTYDVGWDRIRRQRFERMRSLGLLDGPSFLEPSAVERDLGPPYHFPDALETLGPNEVNRPLPWASLTADQKAFQSSKMAIHAAMIHRMDIEIGRVLAQIESMGQRDRTLVVFLSDNGASAEIMVRDDGHDPQASMGSAATYLCLGPGWSTTCNTPYRRHKTWTHEGGISTPLILSWPDGIEDSNSIRRGVGHVIDIVPTILELAGIDANAIEPPIPGRSLMPIVRNVEQKTDRRDERTLWWFHDGHRAVLDETTRWKAVAAEGEPWELYDLSIDRIESNDLAHQHPDRLRSLVSAWIEGLKEHLDLATRDLPEQVRNKALRSCRELIQPIAVQ